MSGAATRQQEVVVIGRARRARPSATSWPAAPPVHHPGGAGEPAAAWRTRWDSIRLFTPVRYDSLPGLTFPGAPDSYQGRDDVVAYLTDYAQLRVAGRVQQPRPVVRPRDGGGFLVELADRTHEADQVVVATGPFQVPFTPAIAMT